MSTLIKIIIDHGLENRIIAASQLKRIVAGSDQRRYNLVNRAIQSGDLIRLQRGAYILDNKYRKYPCHPFHLAQFLFPGSYVSFETALAYHGWIPEAVYTTAGVVRDRKTRTFEHEKMGAFSFHPLLIQREYYLEKVVRVAVNNQSFFIATPFRALMDLVCFRKKEWSGVDWLISGLRIENEYLQTITAEDFLILDKVYKKKRVKAFLAALRKELHFD